MPLYFNPRPREEGDAFITDVEYVNNISIHALVKRATTQLPTRLRCVGISIHALVKRATSVKHHLSIPCNYFNPRPREEGDTLNSDLTIRCSYFNPRPREEGDGLILIIPP